MSSVITRNLKSFILVILICREALTDWVGLQSGTAHIPAHVYPIQLTSLEQLNVLLTWNQTANLDIHIYEQGKDILNMSAYAQRSAQNSSNSQNFTFTPLYNKTYFIKVIGNIGSNRILPYNLKLVTSLITAQYSGIFVQNYSDYNAEFIPNPFSFSNMSNKTDICFKLEIDSSTKPNTLLVFQSSMFRLIPQSVFSICQINSSSNTFNQQKLMLIMGYSLTSAFYLTGITYKLSYYQDYPGCSCDNNTQWNEINKKCEKTTYFIQVGTFPYAILGVLIPATVCIACSIWRYKNYRDSRQNHTVNLQAEQFNETYNCISDEKCSICLGVQCNFMTKCKHPFHRICILEWFKKNRHCPMCRTPI